MGGLEGTGATRVWEPVRGLQVQEGGEDWVYRPCTAPDMGAQRRCRGVPSCGAQGTLRGRRGTEKWQVRGLGESQGKTFQDMTLPRPCRLSLLTPCAFLTLVQPKPLAWGAYPGPRGLPPRFRSSALVLASAQGVEPSGWRVWLERRGQSGPAHLGGAILIRMSPSLCWSVSYLICSYPLRVTLSPMGRFEPQLLCWHA